MVFGSMVKKTARVQSCVVKMLLAGILVAAVVYPRSPGDNRIFSSAIISRHIRSGVTDFGSGRLEYSTPAPMISYGITTGKIFRINETMRLKVPLIVEYGSAHESDIEHISLDDGTDPPARITTAMVHAGVTPQLQLPVRLTAGAWAYGAFGGGVHYCNVFEEEWTKDSRHMLVNDRYLEKSALLTWSATAGGGLEWALSRGSGIFIEYLFTFWYPVKRITERDNLFPLEGKPYREQFLTHTISIGYMISRLF